MDDVLSKHKKMKLIVRDILEKQSRARNDDKYLIIEVWKQKGIDISSDFGDIIIRIGDPSELPNTETIRRVRAEIQNKDGEFPPTDPIVAYQRRIKEETLRKYYSLSQIQEYRKYQLKVK